MFLRLTFRCMYFIQLHVFMLANSYITLIYLSTQSDILEFHDVDVLKF